MNAAGDVATVVVAGRPIEIRLGPGVHRPSPFTQLLIDALPDAGGLAAVDAGSGAGAVTVALVLGGAASVTALDSDPRALSSTAANVRRVASDAPLRLVQGDFATLAALPADVVVANPPQRPAWVRANEPATDGGRGEVAGEDGLGALRRILVNARSDVVVAVVSTLVAVDLAPLAREHGYGADVLSEQRLPHDPVWRRGPGGEDTAPARAWRFTRDERGCYPDRLEGA